jgi:uncharacterized membrane protein YbhN (UPF0104 family)
VSARSETVPATSGGLVGFFRRNLQILLGLLISGWSIYQLRQAIDGRELLHQLSQANVPLLALCAVSIVASMVVKAIRWRYLFGYGPYPPYAARISSLYIGYLMNTVLPARVGEFVRAFLIGRIPEIGTPTALATIAIEKVLDLSAVAVMVLLLPIVWPVETWPAWLVPVAYTSVGMVAAGLVTLAVMLLLRHRVTALVAWLERRLPAIGRLGLSALAGSLLEGLAALGQPKLLPGVVIWSSLVWIGAMITVWTGIAGVGIGVGLAAVLLVLIVTNIGMAVPSAPGYVGVFHYLVVLCLEPFGIEATAAAGGALLIHALIFGNFIIGGLYYLWRGGYSLGGLRSASGH